MTCGSISTPVLGKKKKKKKPTNTWYTSGKVSLPWSVANKRDFQAGQQTHTLTVALNVSLAVNVEIWIDTVSPYAVAVVFLAGFCRSCQSPGPYLIFWQGGFRKAGKATCTVVHPFITYYNHKMLLSQQYPVNSFTHQFLGLAGNKIHIKSINVT